MTLQYDHVLGRQFILDQQDCFAVVQDIYSKNFDIHITDYARPSDWRSDTNDIIERAFEREGFYKVEDWSLSSLQEGDVLCMAVGQSKANHMAVYVGGNLIVHHIMYNLSRDEILRDFWRKSICFVLRHKDVSYSSVAMPTITIEELVRDRYSLDPEQPSV